MPAPPALPAPPLMYGTAWKELETARLTEAALTAGFRAIDTANQRKHYHEAGVGEGLARAIAAGVCGRDEVFLQTKFTYIRGQDDRLPYDPAAAPATQVAQSFASSLAHLGVAHLDSYVLHGPSRAEGLGAVDQQVWGAMEALVDAGKAAQLGISNVTLDQLGALLSFARIPPSFVQNRCYASRDWDAAIRSRCADHGIRYQGFSLLTANRGVWNHRKVAELARAHGCTPAQVVLGFALRVGMLPLTGTTDPRHMAVDLQIVELTDDEVATVGALR